MKRLTKLKNQFNGKLRVSLLILLALQLFVPKLNAQINLTASPTPPTNDCLNPEAIEVENNFQSYEADLSNLNSYYLSFNANKSTLYLDVLGDEEGDLPQSLKLYEEECSETPIEQTYMQTDSNGVQSIELNYHNLNIGQNYIVEIVQNSAASVGNLTLFIRNFDPLDPPLEPIVPECDNFVFNGSFELEDIPGTDVDLNTKIHLSTGYLLINNDYSNNNRADYFHTKGNSDYDIPTNVSGSGIYPVGSSIDEAYAGLFTVNTQQNIQIPEFREWICGQLDQGMVAGKQYEISYYVHLANKQWYHDPCIPPGIAFTSNPTTTISQINILQMVADIQPTKIISDTSKWHKITAYYTATGNEQYFTVANFLSNNESNNKSGRQVSYFFIDEIKVTESCCTALEIPDGWDVNDVLTSPNFGAVVSGSTLNDVNVKVNGTFTVNSNFSANNVTFIMAEDAKIKVTNGNFEVLGSEFRTCSNVMWKGIEVDGGALTIDGSKIKDAIKGINSLNGSAFTVSNTTFDANYYGIYVDAYNGYHTGTVEGSTFDCSYSLKDATVADNTLAGIYVNEVVNLGGSNNLTIGSIYAENTFMGPGAFGSTSSSYFSAPGLLYGIITNKSSVNIYNSHFQSFIQIATINPQKLSAIKVIGVPNNTYYPNNYGPIVNVGSSNLSHKNDFIRTTIAIQSEDAVNLSIRNNNIDFENNQGAHNQNDYAIRLRNNKWPGDDIEILNNEITDVVNGILLSNCKEQLFVNIVGNDINLVNTDGNTGIYSAGTSLNSSDFSIKYNTIHNATKGIIVTNGLQPNVESNTINLNNNFTPSYGIRLVNMHGFNNKEVKKNTINSQSTTSYVNVYGIALESMGNIPKVECNTIKRTGTGLYFSNVINSYPASYQFAIFGNKMENNYNSFVLANGSELDDVGASIYPSDNEWINSANFDTYTDGANGSLTTLFTRGGGLPYEPMSNGANVGSIPVNINTTATGSVHDCDGGIIIGPGLMSSQDSLPDFENKYSSDTAKWIAKYQYYRSLPEDSLISNKSIQAFKDSINLSPLGTLLQLNTSTTSNANKRTQMNALNCNTVQESRLKTVIDYQLQAKSLNWDTLPTAALNSLENIALECPFEAGPAVYEARNLLMRYTAKSYHNPCEGYTSTAKPSQRMKFIDDEDSEGTDKGISLYPNPVKDELNIHIQLNEDEIANWSILNINGQLIQSGSLNNENNIIDLSDLSQGVYFIQLMRNNQLIKTDKLIVQ